MLIRYELQKILRKKSTLIVMAVSLLVIGFLFFSPVVQYHAYDANGAIQGTEGIAFEKKQFESLSGTLTEEYVEETIRQYQELFSDPKNVGDNGYEKFLIGDAYWNFAAPRTKLLRTIARTYDSPYEDSGYDKLPELDMENGAGFYQARDAKIKALLNTPSRQLTSEQIAYWTEQNSKVQTPLPYGFYEGWEILINSLELMILVFLAICIVIAPVFAGEYQAGTAAVLLCGKYGKTKLVRAKIIASLIFGLLAFTIHAAVAVGILLLFFGADGWNLPLQIAGTEIPYPFTFLQATLIGFGILYLVLLGLLGLTLFLSAKMKSPYLVLIILIPVLFIPLFLSPNDSTGLYNLIYFLLPYRSATLELNKYISYQFGGFVLDPLFMRAIVYSLLTVVTLPFARRGFQRHQISG